MNLSWLILSAALQAGAWSGGSAFYQFDSGVYVDPHKDLPCYATLEFKAEAGPVFLGGSVRTDMFPADPPYFDPFQMTFMIDGGLKVGGLTLAMRHTCYHPMKTYRWAYASDQIVPRYEGWTEEVYLRAEIGGRR
jgi:hypothetical protein